MTSLPLTIVKQSTLAVTVAWTPPTGVTGYRFFRDGQPVSSSWDPAKSQVAFSIPDDKQHTYCVVAVTASAQGTLTVNELPSSTTPSTRIYTADFADGTFDQVTSQQESSAPRITLVTPGLGGTKYAAKIICGPQDKGTAGAAGERTELEVQHFSPHLGGGSLQGKEVWVAWIFKLGAGFVPPSNWMDMGQFANYGSPVFAFQHRPDGSVLVEQRGGVYSDNGGMSGNLKTAKLADSLQREREYHVVVNRLFSVNGDGITKVWLDREPSDTPQVSMVGPTLAKGYEAWPYMKFGMYGSTWSEDNTVYVSNIRWATTAEGLN